MTDKQALKQRCCEAIDRSRDAIFALADDIYRHPEMGFHEFRSTEKMKAAFEGLGLPVEEGIAYTGCSAKAGREGGPVVGIMGELDSLNCPDHPDCDANGNVHSCGHHAQLANLYGCAVGLVQSGVLPELDGAVKFIAIPAEEYVEANPGLKIVEGAYTIEDYCVGVSEGNTALLEAVNKALNEMIDDGTVDEIMNQYIGG